MSPLPFPSDRPFDCNDVERFSYAYLDGEFAPAERTLLERHLGGCPGCAQKLQEAASFRTTVRLHVRGGVKAPADLRRRISLDLNRADQASSRHTARELALQAWPSVVAGLAAAACLALLFYRVAPSNSAWVVNDAVSMHTRSLPLEISTGDVTHLLPLFERHLGFAVQPPTFPTRRVALVGGRLSHLGARDAAYLEYGAGPGHRVSLFVISDPDRELRLMGRNLERIANHEVLMTSLRGYNVAVWRRNEIVYSLVSDLDHAETMALLANDR